MIQLTCLRPEKYLGLVNDIFMIYRKKEQITIDSWASFDNKNSNKLIVKSL